MFKYIGLLIATNWIWIAAVIGICLYSRLFRPRTVCLFLQRHDRKNRTTTAVLTYPTAEQVWIDGSLEVTLANRPLSIPFVFENGGEILSIPFRPGQTVRLDYDPMPGRYVCVGEQTRRYRIYLATVD